ncbi:hypothetical protein GC169_09605 [bacterium]|nr:hypothetical protein [bacterium]
MISVLLYGRNDSHGYNLHKRAAISLNCIAAVLSHPNDEILFVDYNTPDDLPTFPEAILDTLTQEAVRRLRILRVRPAQHEAFASRTHLVALEPVSRNVALRRSNPANRWVLSTNTDMIFTIRRSGRTLTDVLGETPDGYYHLPRYELPECMWESLNRQDPEDAIARVRDWGRRFHLDEIVHSGFDNLYDAPGDFQLALREDLFAIDGFNEAMLLGWHVDANIARRMRLLRGRVDTLAGELAGYHCDHTRQATAVHRRERLENDPTRFVDNVTHTGVPEQAENWGLADAEVEEVSLASGSSARYLRALGATLREPAQQPYETSYVAETYNTLNYPAEHVLPFLVDLVSCAPPGVIVGYAGVRGDMFSLFANALRDLDPQARLLLPENLDWLKGGGIASSLEAWCDRPDLFIFEIGETPTVETGSPSFEGRRAGAVINALRAFLGAEERRQAEGARPRRVIAVNAIHTYFEPVVADAIAITLTPYSTRIRHGYVASDRMTGARRQARPAEVEEVGRMLSARMGRLAIAPPTEIRRLVRIAEAVPATGDGRGPQWEAALQFADPLLALLRDNGSTRAVARDPSELDLIAGLIGELRPSAHAGHAAGPAPDYALRDGPTDAATRLFDLEDWERPDWLALARRYYNGRATYDYTARSPNVWERVAILSELDLELSISSGGRAARPRCLVVAPTPERTAAALIDLGAQVDVLDPRYLLEPGASLFDWRSNISVGDLRLAEPAGWFVEEFERGRAQPYDAVVCTQSAIMFGGRASAATIVAALHPWVRPGGVFAFSAPAGLSDEEADGVLSRAFVLGDRLDADFAAATGFEPLRGRQVSMSRRTRDRIGRLADAPAGVDPVVSLDPAPNVVGLWFWRAGDDPRLDSAALIDLFSRPLVPDEEDARAFRVTTIRPEPGRGRPPSPHTPADASGGAAAVAAKRPFANGNQMTRLRAEPHAVLTPLGVRVEGEAPPGVFACADLGLAAAGTYELIIELQLKSPAAPDAVALVQLYSGSSLVHSVNLDLGATGFSGEEPGTGGSRRRQVVEFEIVPGASGVQPLEVRVHKPKGAAIELSALSAYFGVRP